MTASKASLSEDTQRASGQVDVMSGVYDTVRSIATSTRSDAVPYDEALRR